MDSGFDIHSISRTQLFSTQEFCIQEGVGSQLVWKVPDVFYAVTKSRMLAACKAVGLTKNEYQCTDPAL